MKGDKSFKQLLKNSSSDLFVYKADALIAEAYIKQKHKNSKERKKRSKSK